VVVLANQSRQEESWGGKKKAVYEGRAATRNFTELHIGGQSESQKAPRGASENDGDGTKLWEEKSRENAKVMGQVKRTHTVITASMAV